MLKFLLIPFFLLSIIFFQKSVEAGEESCVKRKIKKEDINALITSIEKDKKADINYLNEARIAQHIKSIEAAWTGNLHFIYGVLCETRKRYKSSDKYDDTIEDFHPSKILNFTHDFELNNDSRVELMISLLKEDQLSSKEDIIKKKKFFDLIGNMDKDGISISSLNQLFQCLSLYPNHINDTMAAEIKKKWNRIRSLRYSFANNESSKIRAVLRSEIREAGKKLSEFLSINNYKSCGKIANTTPGDQVYSGKHIHELLLNIRNIEAGKHESLEKVLSLIEQNPILTEILLLELNANTRLTGKIFLEGDNQTINSEKIREIICSYVKSPSEHAMLQTENAMRFISRFKCSIEYQPLTEISEKATLKLYYETCHFQKEKIYDDLRQREFKESLHDSINRALKEKVPDHIIFTRHIDFYERCADYIPKETLESSLELLHKPCLDSLESKNLLYCKNYKMLDIALQKAKDKLYPLDPLNPSKIEPATKGKAGASAK